jgi:hypothetical protein
MDDPIMDDQIQKCARYEEAIFRAIEVMEDVAKNTHDQESFKKLTIGFHEIRDLLGIKEKQNEEER